MFNASKGQYFEYCDNDKNQSGLAKLHERHRLPVARFSQICLVKSRSCIYALLFENVMYVAWPALLIHQFIKISVASETRVTA